MSANIRIHRFAEVTSTNDTIRQYITDPSCVGTVVAAERQTEGRGKLGRKWIQPDEHCSIMMSAVVGTSRNIERFSEVSFVVGVAVYEFIKKTFETNPKIKWVNDIMLSGKKVCGILVETVNRGTATYAIAGIGINITQDSFPEELPNATSVFLETDRKYDVKLCEKILATTLFKTMEEYYEKGFDHIMDIYDRHLWGIGKEAEVVCTDRTVRGIILGTGKGGELLIKDSDGVTGVTAAEEIKVIY